MLVNIKKYHSDGSVSFGVLDGDGVFRQTPEFVGNYIAIYSKHHNGNHKSKGYDKAIDLINLSEKILDKYNKESSVKTTSKMMCDFLDRLSLKDMYKFLDDNGLALIFAGMLGTIIAEHSNINKPYTPNPLLRNSKLRKKREE